MCSKLEHIFLFGFINTSLKQNQYKKERKKENDKVTILCELNLGWIVYFA